MIVFIIAPMGRFHFDHNVSCQTAELLRTAGHNGVTARALGLEEADDDVHLLTASRDDRIFVTHNGHDFILLHYAWRRWARCRHIAQPHAGILVVSQVPHLSPVEAAREVILFGLPAGLPARALVGHRDTLLQVGGVFLIVLGLDTLGIPRIPLLLREWRVHRQPARRGHGSAPPLVGATFALGWTPCIGAILATVMALPSTTGGVGRAVGLLVAYSLGPGPPSLLLAAGFGRAVPAQRRLPGALIVAVGAFMLAGAYQGFFVGPIRLIPWQPPL